MKWRKTIVLLAVLGGGLTAACSFPGPAQERSVARYLLRAQVAEARGTAVPACGSLRISRPTAAPGFETSRMAYQEQQDRLDYFGYHAWVDAPSRMLEATLADNIQRSGRFVAVLSGSGDVPADLRLDSELIELVQVFDGGSSHVVLRFKVHLVDLSTRTLLRSRVLAYEEQAREATPEGGVAAANRALRRLLADVLVLLREPLPARACSGRAPADFKTEHG
jgi:cholesterol transport system auxiliary component